MTRTMRLAGKAWLLVFVAGLSGCTTFEGNLKKAQERDTIQGYEEFLARYSPCEYDEQIKKRIEAIEWKRVSRRDTITACQGYIDKYPSGKYSADAKARIEAIEWESASRRDTITACQGYIDKYPSGKYSADAKARIEAIEWESACSDNKIEAYQAYIDRYSSSRFGQEAVRKIDAMVREDLVWEEAQSANSIDEYVRYGRKYPKGRHIVHAEAQVSQILRAGKWGVRVEVAGLLDSERHEKLPPNRTKGEVKARIIAALTGVLRDAGYSVVEKGFDNSLSVKYKEEMGWLQFTERKTQQMGGDVLMTSQSAGFRVPLSSMHLNVSYGDDRLLEVQLTEMPVIVDNVPPKLPKRDKPRFGMSRPQSPELSPEVYMDQGEKLEKFFKKKFLPIGRAVIHGGGQSAARARHPQEK